MRARALIDLYDACAQLREDAHARAVLVLGGEGEILAWDGAVVALGDRAVEAVGDLVADVVAGVARNELTEGDDLVAEITDAALQACAAALGTHAVLLVVFDRSSDIARVRVGMRRARETFLRGLDAG